MSTEDDRIGHASGWTVDEDPQGGFRWTAYGPAGTTHGQAPTRAEAERAASQAEEDLVREPARRPRDGWTPVVRDDDEVGDQREQFDRLLAAQPDAPPTPAEQAARDDNDALGDR